jgi:hypothetical protein
MLRGRIEELSILPPENTESYAHGEGFVFQRSDSSLDGGNFEPRFVVEEIETEAVVSNDLQTLLRFIESSARGLVSQMHQLLFQRVGEAAESAGNVVSLRDHQSLADTYIELLSTVEFSIDRHGNLSFPELGGGSSDLWQRFQAMLQEQGPEFFQRVEAIAREKALAAIKREQERLAKYKTAEGEE